MENYENIGKAKKERNLASKIKKKSRSIQRIETKNHANK